jgi:RimJ/RimL family protein N-acetyltransferase
MLRGDVVNVRLVRESDLDELIELWEDVRARGPYYPLGMASRVTQQREFAETGYWQDGMGKMIIEDKDGTLHGQILCFKPVPYLDALELAYIVLRPESRGRGYMTEAVSLFCEYLFDIHQINRIQLTAVVGNIGSKRVAEKCGFRSEGILRGAIFQKGKSQDIEMFSLLRDEQPWLNE